MLHLIIKDKNSVLGDLDIAPQSTISDLKLAIMKINQQTNDDFFIIFNGKVLVDERSIGSYDIQTNTTLYISYHSNSSKSKDKNEEMNKTIEKKNSNPMGALFKLMSESFSKNPDAYTELLKSNPVFSRLAEENPQLRHIINDNDLMSEQMEAMMNPENSKIMAKSMDQMMNAIETMPGGFQALNHGIHTLEPLMDNFRSQFGMGQRQIPTKIDESKALKPSDQPLPNITNNYGNQGIFPFSFFGFQNEVYNEPQTTEITNTKTQTDEATKLIVNGILTCIENGFNILDLPGTDGLKELYNNYIELKYKDELEELEEMGFMNRNNNVIALEKSNGDFGSALDLISKINP